MWIYKITNIQNNKIYIGQTIKPIQDRFKRHLQDAINGKLNTHFARAIRKYGPDNFIIEAIDTATSQTELTLKEKYWIDFYDSVKTGYNETNAIYKCGGNTYQSKNEEEMKIIKKRIRDSKLGKKNPMARKIKRINIKTNEVDIFDTIISCARACGIKSGKTSITERLSKKRTTPLKGIWMFEYYNE